MAVNTGTRSTITNTSGASRYFSFIPPHGATLANSASVVIQGDLRSILASSRGRASRDLAALDAARTANACTVVVRNEAGTTES